jgi:hypothetical protein
MNNNVCWDMMSCRLVGAYRHAVSFFREGEAAFLSAVLANFLENTQFHISTPFTG